MESGPIPMRTSDDILLAIQHHRPNIQPCGPCAFVAWIQLTTGVRVESVSATITQTLNNLFDALEARKA